MSTGQTGCTRIFISSSHTDRRSLEELLVHLGPLIREGIVYVWTDARIQPGDRREETMTEALAWARIAIVLISPYYLNDPALLDHELPLMVHAARAQRLGIVSVILSPCAFDETELKAYQTVNPPTRPLSHMGPGKRHEVWMKTVQAVRLTIELINRVRSSSATQEDLQSGQAGPLRVDALTLSETYRSDYQLVDFDDGEHAIYAPEVNILLAKKPLAVSVQPEAYVLPPQVQPHVPFLIQERLGPSFVVFDDERVRLVTDLTVHSMTAGDEVIVQKTDFRSTICTNFLARPELLPHSRGAHLVRSLSFLPDQNMLLDLGESRASNQIGVSTLAWTTDGYLVTSVQGAKNARNQGKRAPSGSGGVDFRDLYASSQSASLQAFLIRAMERELREECGLEEEACLVHTLIIGFARLVHEGGLPEFFGVSVIHAPFPSLCIRPSEKPFIAALLPTPVNLRTGSEQALTTVREALKHYREEQREGSSFQLYLNLLFLEEYLQREPLAFLAWIASQLRT